MTTFTVSATNNSMNSGSFMLFQKPQNSSPVNIFSLAWNVRMCYPQNRTVFNWTQDYGLSWAKTGMLVPGITFMASQIVNADPNSLNTSRLDYSGYYNLQNPTAGGQPGTLSVQNSASVPMNQASIGMVVSGSTVYAAQAQPNMIQVFAPQSNYWIAFGNYQQGEVLDFHTIPNCCQLNFPPGVTSLNVTLNPNGTFSFS